SSPTLGELSVNGKKFLACAMRTMNRTFLLQGSILLDIDRSKFSHILKVPVEDIRVVSAYELGLKESQILQVLFRSL
ncbi:MAG: lipoate--protein ligase, partial [Aquificaceae bacterium]